MCNDGYRGLAIYCSNALKHMRMTLQSTSFWLLRGNLKEFSFLDDFLKNSIWWLGELLLQLLSSHYLVNFDFFLTLCFYTLLGVSYRELREKEAPYSQHGYHTCSHLHSREEGVEALICCWQRVEGLNREEQHRKCWPKGYWEKSLGMSPKRNITFLLPE